MDVVPGILSTKAVVETGSATEVSSTIAELLVPSITLDVGSNSVLLLFCSGGRLCDCALT